MPLTDVGTFLKFWWAEGRRWVNPSLWMWTHEGSLVRIYLGVDLSAPVKNSTEFDGSLDTQPTCKHVNVDISVYKMEPALRVPFIGKLPPLHSDECNLRCPGLLRKTKQCWLVLQKASKYLLLKSLCKELALCSWVKYWDQEVSRLSSVH